MAIEIFNGISFKQQPYGTGMLIVNGVPIKWEVASTYPNIWILVGGTWKRVDPTLQYYQRETFDTGSKFDDGSSIDKNDFHFEVSEITQERLNTHPEDSSYYNNDHADLGTVGSVHTITTSGGFTRLDTGWKFDSPFNNDYVQIVITDI